MEKPMTTRTDNGKTSEIKQAAKKYVDEQLQVLKEHGTEVHISKNGYDNIVKQVVRSSSK
jgi:hypothetical protein